MLRWLKTVVVSDEEKAHEMRQVGTGKTSVSHPLVKRRDFNGDIETGDYPYLRDEPGGCPYCWPGGVRRRGGVSPVRGTCTELGKANTESLPCRVDRVGEGARRRRKPEALSTGSGVRWRTGS
jgi:hypothetical protein